MAAYEMMNQTGQTPLLEVKDFSLTFRQYGKGLRETELEVINKLDLTIHQGEIVAVVGASGSGKSLLANAILGVLPENAVTKGTLNYNGEALSREKQIALRGKEISLIPQSVNALDPLMKTGKQVEAVIKAKNKRAIQQAVFRKVDLPEATSERYPFELSGGMSRRVLAATAMVSGANLVIADEPTPGLDPDALQETLKNLKQLAADGKGMMFITHDIEAAIQLADKIAVFYAGQTVEMTNVENFSGKGEKLRHSYTKALWNALPQNNFTPLIGPQPIAKGASSGCVFRPKYQIATDICQEQPESRIVKDGEEGFSELELEGISYHYPDFPDLFEDLNLSIKPGEIVGIFGHSGSGKSTMAQIIAGYMQPVQGKVRLDGQIIPSKGNHPVQLVWQHPEKAINPRWRMRRVLEEAGNLDTELMSSLGIKSEWLDRWPSELSGGELQRFCVARALAGNAKYIIADEMTTMLDAITQAQIWHAVSKWTKERNIGVLAISHDHHLLQRISDRIINFKEIS